MLMTVNVTHFYNKLILIFLGCDVDQGSPTFLHFTDYVGLAGREWVHIYVY